MSARHLYCEDGDGAYTRWNEGASEVLVGREDPAGRRLHLAVTCRIGDCEVDEFALLDSGAEWGVLSREVAESIETVIERTEPLTMSTRHGKITGALVRVDVVLPAIEGHGTDLRVNATMLALDEDWPGPDIVLGFRGFMERLRLAVQPSVDSDGRFMLFFGTA